MRRYGLAVPVGRHIPHRAGCFAECIGAGQAEVAQAVSGHICQRAALLPEGEKISQGESRSAAPCGGAREREGQGHCASAFVM